MKKLTALALLVGGLSVAPTFAFQAGMSSSALDSEVRLRLANGESLKAIASDAKIAVVAPAALTASLILNGVAGATVVTSLVEAGLPPCTVVTSAVTTGLDRGAMVKAAILGGADPSNTCLLDPTAAGPGGLQGFTGLGQQRSSTIGGGGGLSVSRS
jgi:hypothetical protein